MDNASNMEAAQVAHEANDGSYNGICDDLTGDAPEETIIIGQTFTDNIVGPSEGNQALTITDLDADVNEDGVPFPTRGRKGKWAFVDTLGIGQSRFVPGATSNSAASAASSVRVQDRHAGRPVRVFVSATLTEGGVDGARIWRKS